MRRSRWNESISRKILRKPSGGSGSSTRCGKSRSFLRPMISRLRRVISPNPPPLRASPQVHPRSSFSANQASGRNGRRNPSASTRYLRAPSCRRGRRRSGGLLRDRKSFEIFAAIARRFKDPEQHTRPSSRVAAELAVRATLRAVAPQARIGIMMTDSADETRRARWNREAA